MTILIYLVAKIVVLAIVAFQKLRLFCKITEKGVYLDLEMDNQDIPIITTQSEQEILNETVWESLQRDLIEIKGKILLVINPHADMEHALRDWDLWGPTIFCLFLAVVLALTSAEGQTSIIFTGIFSIVAFGSVLVTINSILLGATVGFFPSICALGYCLVPLCASATASAVLPFIIIKLISCAAGVYWSIISVRKFFNPQIPENKKFLVLYPCYLFYVVIAWVIFVH